MYLISSGPLIKSFIICSTWLGTGRQFATLFIVLCVGIESIRIMEITGIILSYECANNATTTTTTTASLYTYYYIVSKMVNPLKSLISKNVQFLSKTNMFVHSCRVAG